LLTIVELVIDTTSPKVRGKNRRGEYGAKGQGVDDFHEESIFEAVF
jgi:hypothetical protein